jgi:hypothetical protein
MNHEIGRLKARVVAVNVTTPVPLVDVGREHVKYLNRLRAFNAMRYLYAPTNDAGIRALGKKYANIKPGMQISGAGPKEYSPVEMRRRLKRDRES